MTANPRRRWLVGTLCAALLLPAAASDAAAANGTSGALSATNVTLAGSRSTTAPAPASAPTPGPPSGQVDAAALAAFFDGEVPRLLAENHVPGLTVSVVGGGETVFAKGYGLADVERGTPFDPATSLVRIASISKLFTWTAVLQLVQEGKLDLHQDVNKYLTTFHIPDTYPEPITLEHLMSHSAGFEDRAIGVGARTKADVPPLGTFLAEHLPARVRPPGEMSAYSNYGAALAGYIVSQVSGLPYEQYVQEHLLDPLDMRHSTAFEPVPDRLAADQAGSYEYTDGGYRRTPFVFDRLVPDGSVSASADDMARFMLAHLGNGRLGDARILDEPTAELMHQRSFAADPRLDGWAHGFHERTTNGHRVIMHDGSWEAFQSALVLVPDLGLGLFVSANSVGGIDAVTDLYPAFFDRFAPPTAAAAAATTETTDPGDAPPAGFYKSTRSTSSTIAKLLTLTGSARLRVRADGTLAFLGHTWTSVGRGLYQQTDGTDRLAVVRGSDGVTYLATNGPAFQRVPRSESLMVNLAVLLGFAVLALTAVLGLPIAAAVRRLRGRRTGVPREWRAARVLAAGAAAAGLVFLVLLGLILVGDTSEYLYGPPVSIHLLLVLPLLAVALLLASVVTTVVGWRRGGVGVLARTHQVLVLAGLLGLVWFCQQWNLFGWRFG